MNKNVNFRYDDKTGSDRSCSAMLAGRMILIGGRSYKDTDQISQVIGCSLKRIGTMPTKTNRPACNTFDSPTPRIWICFYALNKKGCKRFVSKLLFQVHNLFLVLTESRSSTNNRRFTNIMKRRLEFSPVRHSSSDQAIQKTRKLSVSRVLGRRSANFPSFLTTLWHIRQ